MYKKIVSFILSATLLLMLFSTNLCFAADCIHSTLEDWIIDVMPTARKDGQISRKCTTCQEVCDTMILKYSKVAVNTSYDFNQKNGIDNFDIIIIQHINNKDVNTEINDVFEKMVDINDDKTSNLKDLVRAKKIFTNYYSGENSDQNIKLNFDCNFDFLSDASDLIFIQDYILYFKFIYTPPTTSGGGVDLPIIPW